MMSEGPIKHTLDQYVRASNAARLFSGEQKRQIQRDFSLIHNLSTHLEQLGGTVALIGGYAVDAYVGHVIRPHADIDVKVFLPPGSPTSREQRLSTILPGLPQGDWETTWIGTNLFICREKKTSQRIDIYLYQLAEAAAGSTLKILKPNTNIVEEVEVETREIIDIEGIVNRVLVQPLNETAANKIISIFALESGSYRRELRITDFSDIALLLNPELGFDFVRAKRYLAPILESLDKTTKSEAEQRAERLLKKAIKR